jgi:hypothetical protein
MKWRECAGPTFAAPPPTIKGKGPPHLPQRNMGKQVMRKAAAVEMKIIRMTMTTN